MTNDENSPPSKLTGLLEAIYNRVTELERRMFPDDAHQKGVLDERLKALREEYANRTDLSKEEAKKKEQLKKSFEMDLYRWEGQRLAHHMDTQMLCGSGLGIAGHEVYASLKQAKLLRETIDRKRFSTYYAPLLKHSASRAAYILPFVGLLQLQTLLFEHLDDGRYLTRPFWSYKGDLLTLEKCAHPQELYPTPEDIQRDKMVFMAPCFGSAILWALVTRPAALEKAGTPAQRLAPLWPTLSWPTRSRLLPSGVLLLCCGLFTELYIRNPCVEENEK